jgi:hypothetical protein
MMRKGRAVGKLCFVAALISTLSAATDDAVQVEVERQQLVLDDTLTQSPYLAGVKLVFDARFANQSKDPVDIPDLNRLHSGVVGVTWNGVESQQSDGSWRTVVPAGNLLWKGDTVFADCRSLGPDETVEVKEVSRRLTVYKSNLAGLTPKATLRMNLELSCKQRDGNVILKAVKTTPFIISVPPLP